MTSRSSHRGLGQTHIFRSENSEFEISHEDASFMYTCNLLISEMQFHPPLVRRVMLKHWHVIQGNVERAIQYLVDPPEEEDQANNHRMSVADSEELKNAIDERANRNSTFLSFVSDQNNIRFEEINRNNNQQNDGVFDCIICLGSVLILESYSLECRHRFCLECLRMMLGVKINNGMVARMNCAHGECRQTYSDSDVEAIVTDPIVIGKYRRFKANNEIDVADDKTWCPRADCDQWVHIDVADGTSNVE